MNMTSKERASFRAQANTLDPVFQVGKGGMSEGLINQTDDALRTKELIKIRVLLETCPKKPREVAEELAAATNADVIQVIGGVIVLYRYSPELHEDKKKKSKSDALKGHGIRQNAARKAAQERREKKEERAFGNSYGNRGNYRSGRTYGRGDNRSENRGGRNFSRKSK